MTTTQLCVYGKIGADGIRQSLALSVGLAIRKSTMDLSELCQGIFPDPILQRPSHGSVRTRNRNIYLCMAGRPAAM